MDEFINSLKNSFMMDQEAYLNAALPIAAVLAGGFIVWWIFNFVINRFERRYRTRPLFEKNEKIITLVKKAGHYTILILIGVAFLKIFQAPIVEKIFYTFLIILLCIFANNIASHLISFLETKLAHKTENRVDDVILDLFKRFSGVIIYTTGILLALDMLGLNIMPFVAGAGVAGIAIGFAAKDTLSNLIAGILLIIDRPFEVGDRIEVWSAPANSATWGDVVDIGIRATKIKTTDNIVIVIPNNEIMKRDIINYTTMTDEIRVRIPVGIAYDADVNKAKEIIKDVSLELDWVMRDPGPKVVVRSFGDSAVNLEARVWISEPRRRMDTISHVTDRVKETFEKAGIEIPFPKRDIYIKEAVS